MDFGCGPPNEVAMVDVCGVASAADDDLAGDFA
jgi:hypothetical protein